MFKSRLTTYMLLAAAVAIWGAIAWKLLAPSENRLPPARPEAPRTPLAAPRADTLVADYPDPFLKKIAAEGTATAAPAARPLPQRLPTVPTPRENIVCEHLASIRSGNRTIHIIALNGEQHEIARGDSAAGFVLSNVDRDSLYLVRRGVKYGVALCE